jgi:YVTN family beta-propeller protein
MFRLSRQELAMSSTIRSRLAAATAGALFALLPLLGLAAPPKAYVGNFKDNTVSVIDTGTATVVATVPVAAGPHGMTQTPDGRTVYVGGDGSSSVSVIDTATDRVVRTLEVGKSPHGLAMMPNGRALAVAVYAEDAVVFFDTASYDRLAAVAVPKPHTIAVRPDGGVAYVASQEPGKFALAVVDLKTFTVLRSVPLDKPPRDLEFGRDGKALYFTIAGENAVQVLDPATDRIVARIPTGVSPHVATLFPGASAGTVVVQGPGELLLFDPETNAVLRTIAVGKQPHWLAANGAGTVVYVTNEGSNDVSIVELASGRTQAVPVGTAPRKVVLQRVATAASAGVSISNFAFAPKDLTIEAGETVTWTNDDGAPHGLAYKDNATGTDLLLPGAQFSRSFEAAGTYEYVCSVHPFMAGRVVVRSR